MLNARTRPDVVVTVPVRETVWSSVPVFAATACRAGASGNRSPRVESSPGRGRPSSTVPRAGVRATPATTPASWPALTRLSGDRPEESTSAIPAVSTPRSSAVAVSSCVAPSWVAGRSAAGAAVWARASTTWFSEWASRYATCSPTGADSTAATGAAARTVARGTSVAGIVSRRPTSRSAPEAATASSSAAWKVRAANCAGASMRSSPVPGASRPP